VVVPTYRLKERGQFHISNHMNDRVVQPTRPLEIEVAIELPSLPSSHSEMDLDVSTHRLLFTANRVAVASADALLASADSSSSSSGGGGNTGGIELIPSTAVAAGQSAGAAEATVSASSSSPANPLRLERGGDLRSLIDEAFGAEEEGGRSTPITSVQEVVARLRRKKTCGDEATKVFATAALRAITASEDDEDDEEGPRPFCPTSLAATFLGFRLAETHCRIATAAGAAAAEVGSEAGAPGSTGTGNAPGGVAGCLASAKKEAPGSMWLPEAEAAERARAIELLINGRLAGRGDFREGVACAVGAKKWQEARWDPPTLQALLEVDQEEGGGLVASSSSTWAVLGGEVETEVTSLLNSGNLTIASAREILLVHITGSSRSRYI